MSAIFDKDDWRKRNVAWMQEAYELFNGRHMLCSYLELMGESGILSFELMKKHMKASSQFVALEQNPNVFMENCFKKKQDKHGFTLIYGDAYQVAPRLAQEYEPAVGIFNFDGMNQVGNEVWWRQNKPWLQSTIKTAISKYECCVILLNQTLDKPKEDKEERLERVKTNVKMMADCFRPWGVTSERLLGKKNIQAEKCLDFSFLGQMGAFEVYRSSLNGKERHFRMATTRFIFRKERAKIECGIIPE